MSRRNEALLYLFEDYCLDTDRRELRQGSTAIELEPQVFDLLVFLIGNRERVVSKEDLIASVWQGRIVSESALSSRINAVRCAIGDSGEQQRLIKTFPRKGVRFVGATREEQHPVARSPDAVAEELSKAELALPDKPSIAVLSFTNMSGDPEQEYFVAGMAEDITTALSRRVACVIRPHDRVGSFFSRSRKDRESEGPPPTADVLCPSAAG